MTPEEILRNKKYGCKQDKLQEQQPFLPFPGLEKQ